MKYLIPTFNRFGNISTHKTLISLGISKEDIALGVQTKEDYSSYIKYGINVVLSDAHNAAGNRNGLIKWARQKGNNEYVLIDDDIVCFREFYNSGNGKMSSRKLDGEGFSRLIETGFSSIGEEGVFGIRATTNPIFAKKSLEAGNTKANVPLVGYLMGVRGCKFRFDESLTFSEDIEACLYMIENGNDSVRLERFCCDTKRPNGIQEGGCHELYKMGKEAIHNIQQKEIINKYQGLARFSTKKRDCITITMAVKL